MVLPEQLLNDIKSYCRANSITDINGFIINLVRTAFTIERYGYSPELSKEPEVAEKEVVKEDTPITEGEVIDAVEETVKVLERELRKAHGEKAYNDRVKELEDQLVAALSATTITEKVETPPEKDLYGEKRITGNFGSNLLDK